MGFGLYKLVKYFITKFFDNAKAQQKTIETLDARNEKLHEDNAVQAHSVIKLATRTAIALEKNTDAFENFTNAAKKCSAEGTQPI